MKKLGMDSVKVSPKKVDNVVNNETLSKSKKMIELFELGLEVKEISNILGTRYNFVYNVVSNYCRVNRVETVTQRNTESKKDKIVEMFKQGKSNKEISIELRTNYNYVFNTLKEYKSKQKQVE